MKSEKLQETLNKKRLQLSHTATINHIVSIQTSHLKETVSFKTHIDIYGRVMERETIFLIRKMFNRSLQKWKDMTENGGKSLSHLDNHTLIDNGKAMYDFIGMIFMRNEPVSCVEDKEFRSFSKQNVNITRRKLLEVILQLVELVEHQIPMTVADKKGALMFDGWNHHCMH